MHSTERVQRMPTHRPIGGPITENLRFLDNPAPHRNNRRIRTPPYPLKILKNRSTNNPQISPRLKNYKEEIKIIFSFFSFDFYIKLFWIFLKKKIVRDAQLMHWYKMMICLLFLNYFKFNSFLEITKILFRSKVMP